MREELTLKELMGILVKRWRMLLALGLTFAVLLGGYRVFSLWQGTGGAVRAEGQAAYEAEMKAYELKREGLEMELEALDRQAAAAEVYLEESLLMQVDAYDVPGAWLSLSVQAAPTGDAQADSAATSRVLSCYAVLGQDCELESVLAGYAPLSQAGESALRELMTIDESWDGVLTIQAIGTKDVPALDMARAVYKYLQSKRAEVEAIAGPHTLSLLSKSERSYVDAGLNNKQVQAMQQPAAFAKQIQDKGKELSEMKEPAASQATGKGAILMSGIKYAVLGGIVGVCIAMVVAFLMETMGGAARSGLDMARLLNCRYLGNLVSAKPKKGLDALGERLYGEDTFAAVAKEDRIPLLAANLKEAAGDKKTLLLTGILPEAELASLAESLHPLLGSGYTLLTGSNLLINAETIAKLNQAEAVVLVAGPKAPKAEGAVGQVRRVKEAGKAFAGIVWA